MADPRPSIAELSSKPYKDQCIWYLNGFYTNLSCEGANQVYEYFEQFIKIEGERDGGDPASGNELDPFWSAKFLESQNATMTALERKEAFKAIDADSNGHMSLIEFLIWKFGNSVDAVLDAKQGDPAFAEASAKLTQKMDEINAQIDSLRPKMQAAQEAFAKVKAAEDELAASIAALNAEEESHKKLIQDLEAKSQDESLSTVKKSKAAADLAQAREKDPLPLNKARATQQANLKKVEKARKEAQKPKEELEAAYETLEAALKQAREEYEELRATGGYALGTLYWMERELFEQDKSLPAKRQRYDHSKAFEFTEPK